MFDEEPEAGLDYRLSSVPGSRLRFRGPLPSQASPYVAVLGGSETFGKYVRDPFPALLSEWVGLPVANLGVPQAGLSLFSEEHVLLDYASDAEVTVLQVLGAQNMSNRLYSVHSRRNDRFLGVSPALREVFPDVDFTEINFTGHLLGTLRATSESAFTMVVEELKFAWVQRMRRLLSLVKSRVVLVWIADHEVPRETSRVDTGEPHFIDRGMLNDIADGTDAIVEVTLPDAPTLEDKVFAREDRDAALILPGQADHTRIAEALAPVVADLAGVPGRRPATARSRNQSFSISSGTAVKRSATRP